MDGGCGEELEGALDPPPPHEVKARQRLKDMPNLAQICNECLILLPLAVFRWAMLVLPCLTQF